MARLYALADAVSSRFRALVLLAAFGGLRRGELFGLRHADVDLLHLVVHVRTQRQESKRGEQLIGPPKTVAGRRTLALPTEVVPALEDHLCRWVSPEPSALVFVGEKGAPLRSGVWQKEWDRARRSIGLDGLRLHDLRHVAGTLAAATGAGTKEIMRRLGHATQEAALRYQHATTSVIGCWPPASTTSSERPDKSPVPPSSTFDLPMTQRRLVNGEGRSHRPISCDGHRSLMGGSVVEKP